MSSPIKKRKPLVVSEKSEETFVTSDEVMSQLAPVLEKKDISRQAKSIIECMVAQNVPEHTAHMFVLFLDQQQRGVAEGQDAVKLGQRIHRLVFNSFVKAYNLSKDEREDFSAAAEAAYNSRPEPVVITKDGQDILKQGMSDRLDTVKQNSKAGVTVGWLKDRFEQEMRRTAFSYDRFKLVFPDLFKNDCVREQFGLMTEGDESGTLMDVCQTFLLAAAFIPGANEPVRLHRGLDKSSKCTTQIHSLVPGDLALRYINASMAEHHQDCGCVLNDLKKKGVAVSQIHGLNEHMLEALSEDNAFLSRGALEFILARQSGSFIDNSYIRWFNQNMVGVPAISYDR